MNHDQGQSERVADWYQAYQRRSGADRNDLRTNRGVLFQTLAQDVAVVRACHDIALEPDKARILDVGSGRGNTLAQLIRLGYRPANITGIEIQAERIKWTRDIYAQVCLIHGDASSVGFGDGTFDLVTEGTMFAALTDNGLRQRISSEMLRVCRPGGYLLLIDWRIPKWRDANYRALTKREVRNLFEVGVKTDLIGTYRGALVPPIGRFLSTWLPSLYFVVRAAAPFLVGQVAYLLKRN